ncbi:HMG box protein-like protein [Dendryphion nanum]|uniref:HMG box protein-like protein n=1 Tax=Dendryphion nanum TaxID=256645 RepID=A0A9P9D7Z3_9PLEO|nr:HMG box protein-like protein [Dendryphion nanum]
MKSETLVHHHPPNPPNIHSEYSALHQLASYNAEHDYSYDEGPSHGLRYDSAGAGMPASVHQQAEGAFPPGRDAHGQVSDFHADGQYGTLPAIYSGSPPTPRSAYESEEAQRRTRSGRTIARSPSPQDIDAPKSKPKATPRSRKNKTGKKDKLNVPKLTAPLSVLTKDMTNIPVRNMEEWVNRSVEVRRKEVEKRNGYVTRPMNSFMLYRSAYAERTKQWCLQNNHQIVSSVSGESWPKEPPEIREMYNDFAKIERINHQNAHPTYKFSPSKASAPVKKRKGDFSDDEPSDLDDREWAPGSGRSRNRLTRRLDRGVRYPANNMNPDFFDRSFGSNGTAVNSSAWDMSNDGRSIPIPMQHEFYQHQYFQTPVHPHMGMTSSVMEDLQMRRVDTPGSSMQFSPCHSLLGLPGGNVDLMAQLHSHAGTPTGDDGQVDPMLLAFDGNHHIINPAIAQLHPEFRNGHMTMIDRELDQDSVNSYVGANVPHEEYQHDQWHPDPHMAPMEQGSEFEKWMDDPHVS